MSRTSLIILLLLTLILLAPLVAARPARAALFADLQWIVPLPEEDPTEIEVEPHGEDPTEIEVEPHGEDPTEIEVEPHAASSAGDGLS